MENLNINTLDKLTEKELSNIIHTANNAYYLNNQPILTDNEYDILCDYTIKRFPKNKVAKEGHTKCVEKNKVKLPYEMWSMDKIKPDTNALQRWIKTYKGPYVLSCKLDGVSGLYSTEGTIPKLYTRGNGIVGQDISHFLPYFNLPKTSNITLRGEFIIKKSVFNSKYANDFANPRNFVAGIINQKKPNPLKCMDIEFVAYEVLNPVLSPSKQMDYLTMLASLTNKKTTYKVVEYKKTSIVTNESLSTTLLKWRSEYEYEIDGVICMNDKMYDRQSGNPAHAFAFKMVLSEQMAEAKVLNVIWTASKDGYLKPRVQIEPVILSGVTIEYTTGFNGKFIEENKIGMGAVIRLIRSGDVIPHIIDIIQPAKQGQMPSVPYEWNETNVDVMLHNKEDDIGVREKNITLFFSTLDVDGLGAGNVKKIMTAGFDSVKKILKMTETDFLKVDGFKERMSKKIKESIVERIEQATLPTLMHASNLFGRGFGLKKLKLILDTYPLILTNKYHPAEKLGMLKEIVSMAEKTSLRFVENIESFVAFMKEIHLDDKLMNHSNVVSNTNKPPEINHILNGKKYIMTGFRDKKTISNLETIGAIQGTSINKTIFVLIVKTNEDENVKVKNARELGIPIMAIDDFKKKYNV